MRSDDLPDASPDATSSLRVAAKLSMRLLPLADVLDRSAGADPCVRLKRALAGLVTTQEDTCHEAALLAALRTHCTDVSDMVEGRADPHAGMWAYVAALALHAVERTPREQDDSRELEDLRL